MLISDDIIYDSDGIGEHVIFYYQHLFSDSGDGSFDISIVQEHVPNLITSDENVSIFCVPSYDIVRETVFDMDPPQCLES